MSSAVAVAFQQNLYSISRSITSRGFSATALFYLASNPARAIDRDTTRAYSYQMFCALRSSNNLSVLKWILDEWSSTVMTPLEWSFLTIWHVPSEAWNGIPYLISHKYACSIEEFQRSHVAFKYTVLFRIFFFFIDISFLFFCLYCIWFRYVFIHIGAREKTSTMVTHGRQYSTHAVIQNNNSRARI